MTTTPTIEHPEAWRLLLSFDDAALQYAAFIPDHKGSLMAATLPLPDEMAPLAGIEEQVYRHDTLLPLTYGTTDVLLRAKRFLLLPEAEVAEAETQWHDVYAEVEGELLCLPVASCGIMAVADVPRGVKGFVERTWQGATLHFHLEPLLNLARQTLRPESHRSLWCVVGEQWLDLAVFYGNELQMANSIAYSDPSEPLYYMMSVWKSYELDQRGDTLRLLGATQELATELRRFVAFTLTDTLPEHLLSMGSAADNVSPLLMLLAL